MLMIYCFIWRYHDRDQYLLCWCSMM